MTVIRPCQSFQRHSPHDVHRPRFVYLSDIRSQLSAVAGAFWQRQSAEDVWKYHNVIFSVNVELNALVLRSAAVVPSRLIRDNLVFVAKVPLSENVRFLADKTKLPVDPRTLAGNDVFVVALVLAAHEVVVTPGPEVAVEFEHNTSYKLLESCDPAFIEQVAGYVRRCLVEELVRSDTLAEEVPFHEVSTCDSTLEMSDYKDSFYDMLDLALLESNDTAVEGRRTRAALHDDFIVDINNLRHNVEYIVEETDETDHELESSEISPQTIQVASGVDDVLHQLDEISFSISEQTKKFDNELKLPIKLKSSRPELRQPQPEPQIEALLRKKSLSAIQTKMPVVKKSPSFTISVDFESDKFAPIKGDKKFKHIKVGKVQKFVNLFEEKVQEEDTPSRPPSPKKGSRPQSPSVAPRTINPLGFKDLAGCKDSIKT